MSSIQVYESNEDPVVCSRRVCEWLDENPVGPWTIDEVMITHLNMRDRIIRSRTKGKVYILAAPGGEFQHLRTEGKIALNRKAAAEREMMPYRRVRDLPSPNEMLIATRARQGLTTQAALPQTVKDALTRVVDLTEENAGRVQSAGRSQEKLEAVKEAGAATGFEFRLRDQENAQLRAENERLTALLFALAEGGGNGSRRLPPMAEAAE
jgi:hypothetical protein